MDSHKALPVLNFDRARLDSIELFPFKEAVKAGLGGMMVGHLDLHIECIFSRVALLQPSVCRSIVSHGLQLSFYKC